MGRATTSVEIDFHEIDFEITLSSKVLTHHLKGLNNFVH